MAWFLDILTKLAISCKLLSLVDGTIYVDRQARPHIVSNHLAQPVKALA